MALPASLEGRLRLPVVAAPMFLVSGPDLVVACCRAGVLGSFPALNQRTTAGLDDWLTQIEDALGPGDAPHGVNLVVHSSNRRLADDLAVIAAHRVPVVFTSLGAATEVVAAVHAYGGVVFHDVTNARHAAKAADAGVDGLVCVAAGAGGHAGAVNPFALLAEVRRVFSGTLLLAGGLGTGADVLAARAMGADLAHLGTRFIATAESMASDAYRQMLVAAGAEDVVLTPGVSTVPANFLRASLVAAGLDPDALPTPERPDLTHLTDPTPDDAKAWRDIWSAGQGVAGIDDVPSVAELVTRLELEYDAALARLASG
ncbi:NAD(P)H-dependent flavin oxidoreductase [Propioniciclava soli]|uniref:NAD(P)H-dependent flavin oxidoreductase n=1 Tax=Propioniciclava soli TaxID=2775081 RepID=UPI001E544745|nr:nitronate monooxygenase family protein [Propioniciclava soli]